MRFFKHDHSETLDELTQVLAHPDLQQPATIPWLDAPEAWQAYIDAQVALALAEDTGIADWTAQLIDVTTHGRATIVCREPMIVCGTAWVEASFHQVTEMAKTLPAAFRDESEIMPCHIEWFVYEGQSVPAGTVLCEITGAARTLLTAERSALNFMQTLSATSTRVAKFVEATAGTQARIYDTRKTIPMLRLAQKYATTVGGGANQRYGLYDGILIKENHILAAGSLSNALQAAHRLSPEGVSIQVEVETLAQLDEALVAGARLILLDNMSLETMRTAVQRAAAVDPMIALEASGGVTLETIREIAATGVHRISVGSLTKSVQAIDLSMRFVFREL